MAQGLTLSVIVPVGPGEIAWRDLLDDLSELGQDAEVLLVAARGAKPAVGATGACANAIWLETSAGRARQQNAGAASARGSTLWFLHADSRVPAASIDAARSFCGRYAVGFFDLRFLDDGPRLARLNAIGARLRSRWMKLPFGDQGLILPRRLFDALGGFDEALPAGEDHALVWAVRHASIPLVPVGAPLFTSARRYAEQGWLRTTWRHARLTIAQARSFASSTARGNDRK